MQGGGAGDGASASSTSGGGGGAARQAFYHQEQQQKQQMNFQAAASHGFMAGGNSISQPSGAGSQLQQQRRDIPHPSNQSSIPQQQHYRPNAMQQLAYMQFAMQQTQQQKTHGNLPQQQPQQANLSMSSHSGREQEALGNSSKIQEHMALQAAIQAQSQAQAQAQVQLQAHAQAQAQAQAHLQSQAQVAMLKRASEQLSQGDKQNEQAQLSGDHRLNPRPQLALAPGQQQQHLVSSSMGRPSQLLHAQASVGNAPNNAFAATQMAQLQAWAKDNFDLSVPSNVHLVSQLLSARMAALQKQNETSIIAQQQVQQSCMSSSGGSEISTKSNVHGEAGQIKHHSSLPPGLVFSGVETKVAGSANLQTQNQIVGHSREGESERPMRPLIPAGSAAQSMSLLKTPGSLSQVPDQSKLKSAFSGSEAMQMQYMAQQKDTSQPPPSLPPSQNAVPQMGFTKQQLHILKAQILAFRRLKRGDRTLPPEVLELIMASQSETQQTPIMAEAQYQERLGRNTVEEHSKPSGVSQKNPEQGSIFKEPVLLKVEAPVCEEKPTISSSTPSMPNTTREALQSASSSRPDTNNIPLSKTEQEADRLKHKSPGISDQSGERGKSVSDGTPADTEQDKKSTAPTNVQTPINAPRKYHGPLFDFPLFARKPDALGSITANYNSNLGLSYDVKDLLAEEGKFVLSKKRAENLKKISRLLAINLERKRIRPDLVLRLEIEEKKLKLLEVQARLRDELELEQQEIMAMPDRPYRKFVRQCERQRQELVRQVQQLQKVSREKQLKSIFQWRKKLLEAHWAVRDARTTRNRGVAKYHEKMLKEYSKRKDDDRNKRMEALKNNDVDRYRQILLEQQTNVPGDAAQRYAVLSSFLSQTEEYLLKLGGKITAAKNHQEVEEASNAAAAAARAQGLSEEEIKAAAACAGEEVLIRNRFSEMNAPRDSSSVNKYYNLAHAVSERVVRQPSMLRFGTLRDYQLVGLQWMLSLYNNKLNGILADEMGLGKTVQVMALIAYLMEFKGNYGPHLIIVPNAVLVNWKSELLNWLPSISCIFYVGTKDQRHKVFSQDVCATKFNVLVTTYEFIMYDRTKLSKVDWKYIIIDEAQRMKDRESVLARDLDRYRCQRRLLLTGTPLQNDLKELWSLLNLLLPEIFDNRKAFHDWFSKPFQRDAPSEEDDWLETEKKVIIIHRLHQILEPFMLRRRLEDVEGSLPRKESIVLRCRMSAMQSAIYDWIKLTGTIRVDPEEEKQKVLKNPMYQARTYKNLNNKCMELRKTCNHPLLNYPFLYYYQKDFVVRSCGKLWILDRILIKLQRAGHRVLLFSTMTKLLDILEEYLQWRHLVYRRIDGTTTLEDRELAIVDFNSPDTDCFIFLLSIRAAGRGLNLQTADTVVIYDPDPNPQNEEQAVARAHRIGQTRDVKVIYLEAVVDKIPSYQKEDELRNGGCEESDDEFAGRDRYMGSIESLIRNNIQQYKIDMADEVINAGRFDQRTTHEERRMTLETLLHDEERYQETVHDVPSMQEVNRMIARSEEEVALFDRMDEEFDWAGDMVRHQQVPEWLRCSSSEVDLVVANSSRKPSKNILNSNVYQGTGDASRELSPRKRGRPKGSIYREIDDEDPENSDVDSDERNASPSPEEDGELEEDDDEEYNVPPGTLTNSKEQSGDELISEQTGHDYSQTDKCLNINKLEDAGSSGSSSGRRVPPPSAASMSLQKFGSLSALDSMPAAVSKWTPEDLEEREIALSGDSPLDLRQSGSWNHEQDEGEEEQVLQRTIKRKRSIRIRPRHNVERVESRAATDPSLSQRSTHLNIHPDREYVMRYKDDQDTDTVDEPDNSAWQESCRSSRQKPNATSRKASPVSAPKSCKGNLSTSASASVDSSREKWSSRNADSSGKDLIRTTMSESTQRKCKNVISKLLREVGKKGQYVPIISDWWRKNENTSTKASSGNIYDLQKIEQRVDDFEYSGVTDFIADVQLMLKNVVRHLSRKYEVRHEAEILHDLFFDIMKIAFPDSDFRDLKKAVSFSKRSAAPAPANAPSSLPKQVAGGTSSSSKRPPQNSSKNLDSAPMKRPLKVAIPGREVLSPGHSSKPPQKESWPMSAGGRDEASDSTLLLTHPSDLVICKKKRKDRPRGGPISPSIPNRVGPLSPAFPGRTVSQPSPSSSKAARSPFQRDHPVQQGMQSVSWGVTTATPGSSSSQGIGDIQWAKPAKRMRTESGRRRPTNM